ncbi:galectin-2 isoform X1 [Acinonyx jubatus]|uniref:Galectin n=1 Tax=Acinonyx jubatus TaxID=32536 RepID=A0ABM3QFN4_ACIJB|nr:galectin-2 isoform X1 [Acinonyx jubatus]
MWKKGHFGNFEIVNMDMKLGSTLKIKGKIASDAVGFALNLGQGSSKVDLHFNPRFRESVIVCNSLDGTWGEEQKDGHMCFSPGSEVKFTVTFDNDGFKVKLSDGHQLTFPNRMGHSHLSYLSIQGGLSITSFKID